MNQQLRHQNKLYQYTQEVQQDMQSLYGLDVKQLAMATIDHLVDNNVDFKEVTIKVSKENNQVVITCEPRAAQDQGKPDTTTNNL